MIRRLLIAASVAALWTVSVPMQNLDHPVVDAVATNPSPVCSGATCSIAFTYTGDYYAWEIPSGTTSITFDVRGASGGDGVYPGGNGGKVTGTMSVAGLTTLYVYVGGAGSASTTSGAVAAGGWNGGGDSGASTNAYVRGGGGGASDIRTVAGAWNNAPSLASRKVIAGGGGGSNRSGNSCCYAIGQGGDGGGTTGGVIDTSDGVSGRGGTQAAGGAGSGNGSAGSLATGGIGGGGGSLYFGGGGGGGGFYGGGGGNGSGGNQWSTGGGGGSSYPAASGGIYGSIVHTRGTTDGNGVVTLTYPNGPTAVAPPVLAGSAALGSTLTAQSVTWTPSGGSVTVASRKWQSSSDGVTWTDIAGAVSTSYEPTVADAGRYLRYVESATDANGAGSTRSAASQQVTNLPVWTSNNGSISTSLNVGTPMSPFTFGANGFRVQYSVAQGALPQGLALNGATGILNGTPTQPGSFVAVIRASNDSGVVDEALTFSVTDVPVAPSIASIVARNSGVLLTWVAPNDNGSPISDYDIDFCSGASCSTFTDGVSTSTTALVTGLTNGVTYTFKVSARNAVGPSAESLPSSPIAPDGTPPSVTLGVRTGSSNSTNLVFTVTGDEDIDCATLSASDFSGTNVASIGVVTQTSPSVCSIAVVSSISPGSSGTTTLVASGSFAIADNAGNVQSSLTVGAAGVVVTVESTTTTTSPANTPTTPSTSTTTATLSETATATTAMAVPSSTTSTGVVATSVAPKKRRAKTGTSTTTTTNVEPPNVKVAASFDVSGSGGDLSEFLDNLHEAALVAGNKSVSDQIDLAIKALAEGRSDDLESILSEALLGVETSPLLPSLREGNFPREESVSAVVRTRETLRKSSRFVRSGSLVITEDEGVELVIDARDANGSILPIDSDGRLLVGSGGQLVIRGSGFDPKSMISGWLYSVPRRLGSFEVGSTGDFAADMDISSDVQAGVHTVQINGICRDGLERSIDVGLVVVDSSDAVAAPPSSVVISNEDHPNKPTTVPSAPDASSSTRAMMLGVAFVFVFVFFLLVAVRRRRRR